MSSMQISTPVQNTTVQNSAPGWPRVPYILDFGEEVVSRVVEAAGLARAPVLEKVVAHLRCTEGQNPIQGLRKSRSLCTAGVRRGVFLVMACYRVT